MRRANGPATEDDFLPLDGKPLSAALHLHGDCLGAIEEDTMDHAVGLDGQVQPMSGLIQIAQGSAPANAVGVVAGHRTNPRGIRMIMVRTVRETGSSTRLVEGMLVWQPLVGLETVRNDRTVRAMKVVVPEVSVGLELAEVLEAIFKVPLIVAHGGPGVVIFRHAAQEDLAIDGTGASRHLTAWHQHRWRGLCGFAHELPVMVADHDVGGGGIAVFDLI